MREERRRHSRVAGPFDGNWSGAAGARECRITDLSAGGCFVDALSRQDPGTEITITVVVAGQTLSVPGTVVYVDRVQGFGVQFQESEATRRLADALKDA
jgi:hypothetical protein